MNLKLLGKRILIEKPEVQESPVILTDDVKARLEKEMFATWSRLKVAAVGEDCTSVSVGDTVYVGRALEAAEVLLIEEKTYFMLFEGSISIVWS